MSELYKGSYGEWAQRYRDLGYWPRPVKPGTKACKEDAWTTPDPLLDPDIFRFWDEERGHYGISLLMGSPFPDGSVLGALDIDHDDYVALGRTLLGNPVCGRIGQKGIAYLVRVTPGLPNEKIGIKGHNDYGQALECFFNKSQLVIPPTIHPKTGQPYRWIGTPLHELHYTQLPIIGE